jgi:hypothetical protein
MNLASEKRWHSPQTACSVCGHETVQAPVGIAQIIDQGTEESVFVTRCQNCGHWSTCQNASQLEITDMYRAHDPRVIGLGWDTSISKNADSGVLAQDHWIQSYLRQTSTTPGKCLEIGPGDGALMRALARDGWSCFGIEPGSWLQGDGIFKSLDDLPEDFETDILVLHDVLEHMVDPVHELIRSSSLLKESGLIFAAFPYAESLEARTLGTLWPMVRPLGHLHYFSQASTAFMFSRAGAALVWTDTARVLTRRAALLQLMKRPLSAIYGGLRHLSLREFLRRLNLTRVDFVGLLSRGDQLHVVAIKEPSAT